ncbi:MAG: hypothetical protein HKN21_09945, partial [Candidatus Eisenbacteria bacterium]|nr:hypothetical protein [Candidatus Eisenbacteria bacterium]
MAEARTGYPKVLNFFLSNDVTPADIALLAKWDVLVLDADFPFENPTGLADIRALNPDIQILAYIPINGTSPTGYLRPPATVLHQYWAGIDANDYWLYSVDGTKASDWPGKWSTNLTPNSPLNAQGETFAEWFAGFVYDVVWEQGNSDWDGICLDDVWDEISWLNNLISSPIDSDRNLVADDNASLDTWWRQSNETCVTLLRSLVGPSVPLVANGANSIYSPMNGTMLENFPDNGTPDQGNPYGYAWTRWMFSGSGNYFTGLNSYSTTPQSLMIINTHWDYGDTDTPDTTGRYHAHKRLCLGSTLLGDGYFSMDFAWNDHASLWWEPEYDYYLGAPDGPAYSYTIDGNTIWRRDFASASVVVNPNNANLVAQSGLPNIDGWDAYIGPKIVDPPPPDTIPPDGIVAYWGWAVDHVSGVLRWRAVGDDGLAGKADHYLIRYDYQHVQDETEWANAIVVPNSVEPQFAGQWEQVTITGLTPETGHYFSVRAVDDAGNVGEVNQWTFLITTPAAPPPTGDVTPPGTITTLQATNVDWESADLSWVAVGDDGNVGAATSYDGRLSTVPITTGNWASLPVLPGLSTPFGPGSGESLSLTGLSGGTTYYTAIRAVDEENNMGDLGTPVSFTTLPTPDFDGPVAVTSLGVDAVTGTTLDLSFTAPSDAEGSVVAYEIRYLPGASFPDTSWGSATGIPIVPTQNSGETVNFSIVGLNQDATYSVRMLSRDDSGNDSDLSNTATGSTDSGAGDTSGPTKIDNVTLNSATENSLVLGFTAPTDALGTVTNYELRFVSGVSFPEGIWNTATQAPVPTPGSPGASETVTVNNLTSGTTYSMRIRSMDDSGNYSLLSDVFTATTNTPPPPPDTTGPATITLSTGATGETFVSVSFLAPADAEGTVTDYDLRYVVGSSFPVGSWGSAQTVVTGAPQAPGAVETVLLTGLTPSTNYTFRIQSQDDSGNWSALSAEHTTTTDSPPPPDTTGPTTISNLSADIFGETGLRLTFSAPSDTEGTVTAYALRYVEGNVFDEADFGTGTLVTTPTPGQSGAAEYVNVNGLTSSTAYAFRIQSQDDSGNWSSLSNLLVASTTDPPAPDTTAAPAVTDLVVTATGETNLDFSLTVPVDAEGSVVDFDLRYVVGSSFADSLWESATKVPTGVPVGPGQTQPLSASGLNASTTYAFRIVSIDNSGNISDLSNTAMGTTDDAPPPPDTTGPEVISDLIVTGTGETWIDLQFTSPTDAEGDVVVLDLRFVEGSSFPVSAWSTAIPVSVVVPSSPGSVVALQVGELDPSTTYSFRVQSQDDSGNWSDVSDLASGTTQDPPPPDDTTGPSAVADLLAVEVDETFVRLNFTAPADAEGAVVAYDFRYIEGSSLHDGNWDQATVLGVSAPASAGSNEEVVVSSLNPSTTYSFAVRSKDDSENVSATSNVVSATTLTPPPPPDTTPPNPVSDLTVEITGETDVLVSWTATSDPGRPGPLAVHALRWHLDQLEDSDWD